jgi:hypothetical protein
VTGRGGRLSRDARSRARLSRLLPQGPGLVQSRPTSGRTRRLGR